MVREYRKYIAESRSLVYVSTFLVILLRGGFLLTADYRIEDANDIALALRFPFLFENPYALFLCSTALTVLIALQLAYLNDKYALIRGKTSLPYVFALLLLSVFPDSVYCISPYVGIIVVLSATHVLFVSYHQARAARQAFYIGFLLGAAGLVFHGLLFYLILFWLGFSMMRSFGFKAFLASLFALGMVCWLKLSYMAYMQGTDCLPEKFAYGWSDFDDWGFLAVEKVKSAALAAIYAFAVLVVLADSFVNKFNDKMQVRTNLSFLNRLLLFSLALYLFHIQYKSINLIIALVISGFILAHFFALANRRWKVYFFIVLVALYFANYAWTIISLLKPEFL
ncbi:MAG: hypothetical protein LBR34_05795 [Prevotella sp.]|nr:hypothetical protein [Prevotella sp.]